jgi:hypothetical protein
MKISQCTAYNHKDCEISPEKWALFTRRKQSEEWLDDDTFVNDWHSFDCLHFNKQDGLVYAGLTATNGDFFYTFNPENGQFNSQNFPTEGDRYAHKIHFGLQQDSTGVFYGGVATLSDVDVWPKARGGQLFRYNPADKKYQLLGIPLSHDYIQGIVLDENRNRIYGNTFPGRNLFSFDLETGKTCVLTNFGATLSESIIMDSSGGIWHNYHLAQWADRTPLLRYSPDLDSIEFLNLDLPDAQNQGKSTIDSYLRTKDQVIFIGGSDGSLSMLLPDVPAITYLGKPTPGKRLKGLVEAPNGLLIGVAGSAYKTVLFSYHRGSKSFDILGPVQDSQNGKRAWLVHDLCMIDETTYIAAETDNPYRASSLFVMRLSA